MGQDDGMHTRHSRQTNIPQTLIETSFEDSSRAQQFASAVNGLAP